MTKTQVVRAVARVTQTRGRDRGNRDKDGFKLPYPMDEKNRDYLKDLRRKEKN